MSAARKKKKVIFRRKPMLAVRIQNIPPWVSEMHLRDVFYSCGPARQYTIVADKNTYKSKGVGFIIFEEESGVANALAKNGAKLDGSIIEVSLCPESMVTNSE